MDSHMERSLNRLNALRSLLDDAANDANLPEGTRGRLELMTGRMANEIEMLGIRGTLRSAPPAAPAPTPAPANPPSPRVLKNQCSDGWANHSWQGANVCARCGAKR